MNEYKTKFEEGQRTINDFTMHKAKLQAENGNSKHFLFSFSFFSPFSQHQKPLAV